ncbi:hypothetical protein A4A49_30861 [Nicotiana attenuata]|uniref:Uncharacterized protein n=1 Tax=Nicotiana attenuata TaxID=49451 RepID=A0A1J6KGK8_NICAT|nr:hypothetical protein A4A49_30861 [Nicotiana attenuata]
MKVEAVYGQRDCFHHLIATESLSTPYHDSKGWYRGDVHVEKTGNTSLHKIVVAAIINQYLNWGALNMSFKANSGRRMTTN